MTTRFGDKLLAAILVVLACANAVHASLPPNVTPEERALLPRWCGYVQGGGGPQHADVYRAMVARYGDGWTHMHHHCWALMDIMRLDRHIARESTGFASWTRALANLDYVLRNTDVNRAFPFRQEVLARKARLLARFSTPDAAAKTAAQLIEEWPKVADGYLILANLLKRAGKRDDARRVLAMGEAAVEDKQEFARQRSVLDLN